MNDRALVTGLRASDPHGLAETYRAYGDQIHTYCYGLLLDSSQAVDATHDTFVLASQRAGQLQNPDRLRWWLYAIARNECLRRLPRRAWRVPPAPSRPDDPGVIETAGVTAAISDASTAELSAVDPDAADPGTDDVSGSAPGTAVLPAPAELWPRLELHALDPGLSPEREAVLRSAGKFARGTGFPRPLDVQHRRRVLAIGGFGAAVAGVVLLTAAATVPPDDPAADRLQPPAGTGSPTLAESPTASPSPTATTTPTPTPSPTGSASPSATPPTRPPQSSPLSPPEGSSADSLRVEAGVDVNCVAGGLFGYRVAVTATANEPLRGGELVVDTGADRQTTPLSVDGRRGTAESDLLSSAEFEWSVAVTGESRRTTETDPAQVDNPCT